MTVNEFYLNVNKNLLRDEYFIFIDEFSAQDRLIFFRNLCRYLRISCVLASTIARITNLIGKSIIAGSGGAPPGPWSVVFNKLPTLLPSEIKYNISTFTKLNELVAGKTTTVEIVKMTKLASYLKQQCSVSRPGFSSMIFDSINRAITTHYSFEPLSKKLYADDFFQLLIEESIIFDKTFSKLSPSPSNSDFLIDSHFFYLRRPPHTLESEEPFLLMRRSSEEVLRLWTLINFHLNLI